MKANEAIQNLGVWDDFKYNKLPEFKENLTKWIKHTALQTYVLNCSGYL